MIFYQNQIPKTLFDIMSVSEKLNMWNSLIQGNYGVRVNVIEVVMI